MAITAITAAMIAFATLQIALASSIDHQSYLCDPPTAPQYGGYNPTKDHYGVGYYVTFYCNDGYDLQGDARVYCRYNRRTRRPSFSSIPICKSEFKNHRIPAIIILYICAACLWLQRGSSDVQTLFIQDMEEWLWVAMDLIQLLAMHAMMATSWRVEITWLANTTESGKERCLHASVSTTYNTDTIFATNSQLYSFSEKSNTYLLQESFFFVQHLFAQILKIHSMDVLLWRDEPQNLKLTMNAIKAIN